MSGRGRTAISSSGRTYELVKVVGRGGFGSVWHARVSGDAGFSKDVAIKLLNTTSAGQAQLGQRFRDEARILALLRHRAIVAVEDLARVGDQWGVVMEYVEGTDLHGLIEIGPVPPRAAIELVGEVAGALRAAHGARDPSTGQPMALVHRDIKPSNIRVSLLGEVKVLDFGVAHAEFSQREAITINGSFGSDGYLAPERLDFVDTQSSDIYALGVVLWECLTAVELGQLPRQASRHQAALDAALDYMREHVRGRAAAGLGELIGRMLAFSEQDRPSAAVVETELQRLLEVAEGPWLKRWAEDMVPVAIEAQAASKLTSRVRPAPFSTAFAGAAPVAGAWSSRKTIAALLGLALIGAIALVAGLLTLRERFR